MIRQVAGWCVCVGVVTLGGPGAARGDQFDLLDGPTLNRLLKGPDALARPGLTVGDIGAMPARLRDSRSALILARTDAGNPARLLLVPEFRKPPGGAGEPIPVLVVERLDTFDAGDPNTRLASRRDVVLFDGMPLDLDTGQVVPLGQGGDVVFRAGGAGEPHLEPVPPAGLFTLSQAPGFADVATGHRPSPGRAILPSDFAGRYRLFANGQWSGTLDLDVAARGVVSGRFRSDLHGTAYAVTGQVATDAAGKLRFSVALPRARQEFDAYLFGEGKGAMAGTLTLLDRTFGFFAIRDGGRYAPETRDLGPLRTTDRDRPGKLTIDLAADGSIRLEGKPVALGELAEALKPLADPALADPAWVLITTAGATRVAALDPVLTAIRAAEIGTIRFAVAEKSDTQP